jgi:hypothetical protein
MPLSPATNSEVYARPVAGSTAEQFLDQAEDCRRLSSKARKAVDKAFWLRLSATGWNSVKRQKLGTLDQAPARRARSRWRVWIVLLPAKGRTSYAEPAHVGEV